MKKDTWLSILYGIFYIVGMYLLLSVSDSIGETITQFTALTLILVSLEGVEFCNKNKKYK